jgi:hypothetical protein
VCRLPYLLEPLRRQRILGALDAIGSTRTGGRFNGKGRFEVLYLTYGARTVEIHHMAGNNHGDGMLMVYLPREKLLSQADAFTPPAPNAPPPAAVNPNTVNLADNISRLGLAVDQLLPLRGRIVPLAELHKAIGRAR